MNPTFNFFLTLSFCIFSCTTGAEVEKNYMVRSSSGELKDLRQITFEIEDSLAKYREKMRTTRNEIIRLNALDLNVSKTVPEKSQVQRISIPEQKIENEKISLTRGNEKVGFYLLPFIGINFAEDFDWTPSASASTKKMQQSTGFSYGFISGKSWDNLFVEFDLGYLKNQINGFEGEVVTPFSMFKDGHTRLLKMHINTGLSIDLGEMAQLQLGGGLGLSHQKVLMDWVGSTVKEEDSALGYQFFSEIHFNPTKDFKLGLKYEWNSVPEINTISSRQIHQISLLAGYVF
jgi:opacity protein-like surface antigen